MPLDEKPAPGPLRLLPETLVNRIAAGEVIERPAAAVKELVENALDAGATQIDVVIREGGQSEIRVTDNGKGMNRDELILAVERHATSKLNGGDLTNIHTLGFRGEALPSIGAVAELTITSRPPGQDSAWKLVVDGGGKGAPEPAAHPLGTRIEVHDLFRATPARLKFLKTSRAEQGMVTETVNRLAMAHPHVGFSLHNGDRYLVKAGVEASLTDDTDLARLSAIMGRDFADNAIRVEAEREGVRLSGYAGLPTYNRGNSAMQFLFVNGRPVKDKVLLGAVRGAYREFLASDRYPLLALFIDCAPAFVDVNVHPAKTEVRFREAGLVRGLIISALKHALAEAGHRASTTVADAALGAFRPGGLPMGRPPGAPSHQPPPYHSNHGSSGMRESARSFHAPLPNLNGDLRARGWDAPAETAGQAPEPEDHALGVARAQLHQTYVIAQTADGVVIVDQHAAHERLTQEKIKAALETGGVAGQMLLIPEVVELEEDACGRLAAREAELAGMGLVIERFGPGAVVVRETPALLGETDVQSLIRDLADDLAEFDETIALSERIGDVCATMACHGSIRAGRRLNADEMNALLREMEATPHAGQCSHGRPTYVELKLGDIEKLFGRR